MSGKPKRRQYRNPHQAKKNISKSRQAIARRARQAAGPIPDTKKCTRCGQWKDSNEEFYWQKRVLVSGEHVYYPIGQCKSCRREESKKSKQRAVERLGEEGVKERDRIYQRRRAEFLKSMGLPTTTRGVRRINDEPTIMLPVEPFRQFLIDHYLTPDAIGKKAGYGSGALQRYVTLKYTGTSRSGATKTYTVKQVSLEVVDRVLTALENNTQLHDLYPDI